MLLTVSNINTNGPTWIKILISLLVMFLIGAVSGYGIEVLFRRFFTVKKWVNPGFMKGPWLPMYGFGLVFLFVFCLVFYTFLPDNFVLYNPNGNLFSRTAVSGPTLYDLLPIVVLALSMILLEFVAGIIFVKGFKVRLWDYSNMKGNILGVICPVFNVLWFSVAVVYYYGINPFVYSGFQHVYAYLFGSSSQSIVTHFGTIFVLGIIYGVFLIDLVDSIGLFAKVEKLAQSSGIIQRYEKLREESRHSSEEAKKKFFAMLPSALKKTIIENKDKGKSRPSISEKVYEEVRKAIMIDPNKKGTENNYDEHGRPLREETKDDKKLEK